MKSQTSIDEKFHKLQSTLLEQKTFIMSDVEEAFPELSKATLYWLVSEFVKQGYVNRIRRGAFAFNDWKGMKRISISKDAERLSDVLAETGFYFFISGLDILSKYMQHVPEQFPIILFVEKSAKEELRNVITENGFLVYDPKDLKERYETDIYAGRDETQVVMYLTDSFEYAENGLASIEKAFVDTYFSVTRNGYPLALQELVRIYENLTRIGNIDQRKTITIASKRSIQYDIRYIVESKYITDKAQQFVEIMRKGR